MKTANSKLLTGRHALMLAVAMAPFAAAGQAQAACSPVTSQANPVHDATVTCDKDTTGQNGTNGYGSGAETNITINVLAGVTVSGNAVADGAGLAFTSGT